MAEGQFCNKSTVNTEEGIRHLLSDTNGKTYYKEMEELEVDSAAIQATFSKTLKSRLKTWLDICTHCGLCADSCFYYLANDKAPNQVPS